MGDSGERVRGEEWSAAQRNGEACVVCGRDDRPMEPVEGVETRESSHVFCCAADECRAVRVSACESEGGCA